MINETSFLHRAMAACGAIAMTVALLVSYFATPQAQSAIGILA